jgi:hypothetical protein
VKLPIPVTTQIDKLGTAVSTAVEEYESLLKNVVVTVSGDMPSAERRKGIVVIHDASATLAGSPTGRGLHQSSDGTFYYVANNTVYKNAYSASHGSLGASSQEEARKVFFTDIDDATYDVALACPANNTLKVMNASTFTDVAAAPAVILGGVVQLNGRLFVASNAGRIYNSDLNAPTTGYTDFVTAERRPDLLSAIVLHHDHIVALGTRSIEFFYHAENPGATGSPLRRRQDVFYNYGVQSYNAFVEVNDVIWFVGRGESGDIGLYKLDNFRIVPVGGDRLTRLLENRKEAGAYPSIFVSAIAYENRNLITVSFAEDDSTVGGDPVPFNSHVITVVFEEDGRNYVWDTDGITELANFPLIGWITGSTGVASSPNTGRGMMTNGDVFKLQTRTDRASVFKDDLGTEEPFTSTIEFNSFDGDVTGWKFCHAVEPIGSYETACTFNLSWSDEGGAYNTPRVLTKANRQRAVSCGRFSRRKFRLTSEDDSVANGEFMSLEGLDVNITPGQY